MLKTLQISADQLVSRLVSLPSERRVSLLDSCGVGHLGSHLLIAGFDPVETVSISGTPDETLTLIREHLSRGYAAIFTISYDFGSKLQNIRTYHDQMNEPDAYIALYDSLVAHDYASGQTFTSGRGSQMVLPEPPPPITPMNRGGASRGNAESNFDRPQYIEAVETIKDWIRRGDTYQTNLTQTLRASLSEGDEPGDIFMRLRSEHPAPFGAFIERGDSQVISASPERFFRVEGRTISTSPIKGTRPRGENKRQDKQLCRELLSSGKDRAENTMIVDLLRNDLGRVCEYGSVDVKKLCDLEVHPTLFHLVSTVEGRLRTNTEFADILTALFPCGSITGAPKIRTMQLIDQLESTPRGLSMGAIGYFIPESGFEGLMAGYDLSVAIRTMVVRNRTATFNVGGGVTIESDPGQEYEESMLKAKALLAALGNK